MTPTGGRKFRVSALSPRDVPSIVTFGFTSGSIIGNQGFANGHQLSDLIAHLASSGGVPWRVSSVICSISKVRMSLT